ncbi:alpha/beta fold hydrolase [Pigmentibacter sp. JX0631]|uniref:alpha/beta fold hydrolase n=1 Tax=Pigmentibacter sp. JX0631 TaxID=2976982 RepID=UPI002469BEC6|nr:alpha/beta fold hydrolase [Pigmentibacter sp. JX0631]WGL59078.1 alpha/beta fold hydrolase [Pigmentibacter sp. JX0631]
MGKIFIRIFYKVKIKIFEYTIIKYVPNFFGLIFLLLLLWFWGTNKINRKKIEIFEHDLLNQISNTTNLNQYVYNKWHRCEFSTFSKLEKCMKIKVPLNWEDKNSEKIGFFIRRYGEENPKKIILILSGGPGGIGNSYISLAKEFYEYDKTALVLMPDHRGTGYSENLHCPIDKRTLSIQDIDNNKFASCFDYLKSKWQDKLKHFNSSQAGQDIHELIKLYPNIPIYIYASSYGTIWAQRVLNKKTLNIKKVYLESPFIAGKNNFLERNLETAVFSFYDNCKQAKYCSDKIQLNNIENLKELFRDIAHKKRCSHEFNENTRELIAKKSLWLLQYNYTAPLFPLLISGIKHCDEHIINNIFKYKSEINVTEIGNFKYSVYLHYNVFCNEIIGSYKNNNITINEFGFIENYINKCQYVPFYSNENSEQNYKNLNVKTLIVTGEADVSATKEFALELKEKFMTEKVRFVGVKNLAHIPLAFRINYEDFFEQKYLGAEKCRLNILFEFFNEKNEWPNLQCLTEIYPPIYSSDNALKYYESIFNNS